MKLEDYAIIGDTHSVALVGRTGSIDWLCLPRFDSPAFFAALLGRPEHGHYSIRPVGEPRAIRRRYREDSLILETEYVTDEGSVRVVDGMPIRGRHPDIVRIVEGIDGAVPMRVELVIRFDYGHIVPWLRAADGCLHAISGPSALVISTPIELRGDKHGLSAEMTVRKGDRLPFVLTWRPSYEAMTEEVRPFDAIEKADRWWRDWAQRARMSGPYRDMVVRSLLTLKALTYAPTGGILAAPTTSLPEHLGGVRNWDYRSCWLRDSTFTLFALMHAGYMDEAKAWSEWLLRAAGGDPGDLQTVYGPAGERDLTEHSVDWLPGYAGSRPIRIGTKAAKQFQIDIYGEVLNTQHWARDMGFHTEPDAWVLQRDLGEWLASHWREDDNGLWEIHGDRRPYVHSKVMAWVAMDRLTRAIERDGFDGPVERFRRTRQEIHDDVCEKGFDRELGSFTQSYGAKVLDASGLLIPMVGFLPADDPRVQGTIAAIERHLVQDGLVFRYATHDDEDNVDGLPGREGAFIACTFWLVNALTLCGRHDDACKVFEGAIAIANDVGLLSEEYDVERSCLVGNFPQALSHLTLVNAARNLAGADTGVRRGQ